MAANPSASRAASIAEAVGAKLLEVVDLS